VQKEIWRTQSQTSLLSGRPREDVDNYYFEEPLYGQAVRANVS
jgi:hypothetical protein